MAANQFAILFDEDANNLWAAHLIISPAVRPSGGTRSQQLGYMASPIETEAPITVSGATNATPIVLTVPSGHGIAVDDYVFVTGVGGNTAANGTFRISVSGSTTVTLEDSAGNAAYTSGGKLQVIARWKNLDEVAMRAIVALFNERSAGN